MLWYGHWPQLADCHWPQLQPPHLQLGNGCCKHPYNHAMATIMPGSHGQVHHYHARSWQNSFHCLFQIELSFEQDLFQSWTHFVKFLKILIFCKVLSHVHLFNLVPWHLELKPTTHGATSWPLCDNALESLRSNFLTPVQWCVFFFNSPFSSHPLSKVEPTPRLAHWN